MDVWTERMDLLYLSYRFIGGSSDRMDSILAGFDCKQSLFANGKLFNSYDKLFENAGEEISDNLSLKRMIVKSSKKLNFAP